MSFFPQLIAGPIVRYQTVEEEIRNRHEMCIRDREKAACASWVPCGAPSTPGCSIDVYKRQEEGLDNF